MDNPNIAHASDSVADQNCVKEEAAVEDVNMNNSAEEIVVEYNHNDYAHLIGDGFSLSKTEETALAPVRKMKKKSIKSLLRRPGCMPPFGLFTQVKRAQLKKENPDLKFSDLGRKLGEMWKALGEDEKEGYKSRAKDVSDRKFLDWRRSGDKRRQEEQEKNERLQKFMSSKKMKPNFHKQQGGLVALQDSSTSTKSRSSQNEGHGSQELELNLPWGITVSKVEPDTLNLPYGITVSRVQPNIEVLLEKVTSKSESSGRGIGKNQDVVLTRNALNSQKPGKWVEKSLSMKGQGVQRNAKGLGLREGGNKSKGMKGGATRGKVLQGEANGGRGLQAGANRGRILQGGTNRGTGLQGRSNRGRGLQGRVHEGRSFQGGANVGRGLQAGTYRGRCVLRGRGWHGGVGGRGVQGGVNWGLGVQRGINWEQYVQGGVVRGQGVKSLKRPWKTTLVKSPELESALCRVCAFPSPALTPLKEKQELVASLQTLFSLDIDIASERADSHTEGVCKRCCEQVAAIQGFQMTVSQGQERLRKVHGREVEGGDGGEPLVLVAPSEGELKCGEERHTGREEVEIDPLAESHTESSNIKKEEIYIKHETIEVNVSAEELSVELDVKQETHQLW